MDELADCFSFAPGATVILTAAAKDAPLERWWSLGKDERRRIVRALVRLGIDAATSPNFSLFTDRPRHDDMHSAKRIGITWQEMADEGLATALHVNARTDSDWDRWTRFITAREEVGAIAYEFATPRRRKWHAERLIELAHNVGRPIRLIVRGGGGSLPQLARAFATLTVLDTEAYAKTIHRQRAEVESDGTLRWFSSPTDPEEPLDRLFAHNVSQVHAAISREVGGP